MEQIIEIKEIDNKSQKGEEYTRKTHNLLQNQVLSDMTEEPENKNLFSFNFGEFKNETKLKKFLGISRKKKNKDLEKIQTLERELNKHKASILDAINTRNAQMKKYKLKPQKFNSMCQNLLKSNKSSYLFTEIVKKNILIKDFLHGLKQSPPFSIENASNSLFFDLPKPLNNKLNKKKKSIMPGQVKKKQKLLDTFLLKDNSVDPKKSMIPRTNSLISNGLKEANKVQKSNSMNNKHRKIKIIQSTHTKLKFLQIGQHSTNQEEEKVFSMYPQSEGTLTGEQITSTHSPLLSQSCDNQYDSSQLLLDKDSDNKDGLKEDLPYNKADIEALKLRDEENRKIDLLIDIESDNNA